MKKLSIVVSMIAIALLIGCANTSEHTKSGEIVAGSRFGGIEFQDVDGKFYGLVAKESTELVWKNENMYAELVEEAQEMVSSGVIEYEYEEWEFIGPGMCVEVEFGEKTGNKMHLRNDLMVDSYLVKKIVVTGLTDDYINPFTLQCAKPVIYLYPENETSVSVDLDYAGRLTCTYPEYKDGWEVFATPEGTLTDKNGQTYNYLYWEGIGGAEYDLSEGYCVKGEDTAAFLEETLAKLGLNRREANEFIVYWLPLMQGNPYNIISFQTDIYTETAKLYVNPEPDTIIRVFMAWKGADSYVELPEQELATPERTGFTVVEWGGTKIP